jgi:hypothetical protein
MKVEKILIVLAFVAIAGVAGAKTILVVSDQPASGGREDTLVAWLESLGYTVDTSGMDQNFREGGTSPWGAGNEAKLAALNAADLIFVARHSSSGNYNDDRKGWNELETPLLMNGNIALTRGETNGERWGWQPGDDSGDDDDTFWVMTDGSPNLEMWDWTGSPAYPLAPKDIGRFRDPGVDGPIGMPATKIIALYSSSAGQTRGCWVEFPVGTDFDAGQFTPTTDKYGTTTAMRVFFTSVSYDGGSLGPGGTNGDWSDYQLPLYKTTLAGVIEELTGGGNPTYNPGPSANAGPDQTGHVEDTFQLAGTASDNGPLDGVSMPGTPGGIVSASWYQQSGPEGGLATITPADTPADDITDILNSTVTFSEKGVYELVLQVSDIEPKDANDLIVITVKDHADEFLIGHWEMEDNLLDSTASANHGEPMADSSPEIAFVDGIDGGRALLLDNPDRDDPNGYVHLGAAPELDIQSDPPEFTVTAWFKTTNGSDQIIIGKGGDDDTDGGICWLLLVDSRGVRFVTDDNDNKQDPRGPQDDNDGIWHFAAGVSDSWGLRVYVDGVLTADDDRGGAYDISGSSQRPGFIGAGTEWDDTEPNQVNSNIFDGVIDDVRVYNYALPLDDVTYDSVLGLASMGPLVASVDAGADIEFNWKPGKELLLAGVVTDFGVPDDKVIMWTTLSGPTAEAEADFGDTAGNPAASATFEVAGVYVLELTVIDPDSAEGADPPSDTVTVTLAEPTCADVIADGLMLSLDLTGPDGVPDCYVDIYDLAIMLSRWGECNDPADETGLCEWPPFQ